MEYTAIKENTKKEFYIAIVGTWCAGKSSFLNALTGKDIIPTGILPNERSVPIYIHWDKKEWMKSVGGKAENGYGENEPILSVTFKDGRVCNLIAGEFAWFQRMAGASLAKNTRAIMEFIYESDIRIEILKLDLHFPEHADYENMCMVDIPSQVHYESSGNEWITEIDTVIIIDNVQRLYGSAVRDIMNEIYKYNPKLLEEATMVLTHVDTIPEGTYREVIPSIRKMAAKYLHNPIPKIFGVSSYKALQFKKDGIEEDRVWAEKFEASVQEIMSDIRGRCLRDSIVTAFSLLPGIIESLNGEEKKAYTERISQLQTRFHDPEFRLAIIGNFSCGKSTFLNALIGRELLSTSDIPTTAIPTYIRWNKEEVLSQIKEEVNIYGEDDPFIVLTARGGTKYHLTEPGLSKLKAETGIHLPDDIGEMIDYITTSNSLIRTIEKIDISFPKREGFENFCLIDTPGMNPGDEENKEHIIQTQTVLREDADAAIVLYTAKDAMSKDTRQFMEENAMHLMKNAIIILTKMDLVPDKQISKVIRSTTQLVREQFHQSHPNIYSISAGMAVEYASGRSLSNKDREWAEGFEQAVSAIINQLHARRTELVSQRIASVMKEMIETMSVSISRETEELQKEHERLQRASSTQLRKEFHAIKSEYKNSINSSSDGRKSKAKNIVSKIIDTKAEDICKKIDSASNTGELNSCLGNYYQSKMKDASQEIVSQINKEIISELNTFSREYIKKAEKCLDKYNRYLGKINARSVSVKSGAISDTALVSAPSAGSSFPSDHAALLTAGGITLFIPGVNLLVLAAGFIWDAVRFESKKGEAKTNVQKKLMEYKNNLIAACQDSIRQTEAENLSWAIKLLEEYRSKYSASFESIERDYERHSIEVVNRIGKNRESIITITQLKERLTLN